MLLKLIYWFLIIFLIYINSKAEENLFINTTSSLASYEPVSVLFRSYKFQHDSLLCVELTLEMGKGIHIYSAGSLYFEIKTIKSQGLGSCSVKLPKSHPFKNPDNTISNVYSDTTKIILFYPILSTPWSLQGYIQFQACDSVKCYFPSKKIFTITSTTYDTIPHILTESEEKDSNFVSQKGWKELTYGFYILGKAGGYLDASKFLDFIEDPASFQKNVDAFARKSIFLILALVLLGGFALNLTPCVLPMLPITLAILGAGSQFGFRLNGFILGTTYGLAMAVTYGILGLVVILSGSQFGVINSSPVFNIAIAVIFVILALGMFDVIHIDFTKFRSGIRFKENSKGKIATAFFMGIIAALLAGACVAPVVISTILYATTLYINGQKAGLLLPFVLGIGMAIPWPIVGAGLSFIPKPGKWMVALRNLFGIIILVIALYYGYSGIKIFINLHSSKLKEAKEEKKDKLLWYNSIEEGLQQALVENKPVLIDFWATWCKNCTAMDATTFKNSRVQHKLKNFLLVKFQAENPQDKETKEVLEYYKVVGLPTYIVLKKKN